MSATWWKDGPETQTGELRSQDIGTEVFFLPAAAHTEKAGSFTNTQRLLQWHHQAVEPACDARSDLWFIYHLGRRIGVKFAGFLDRELDEEKSRKPSDPRIRCPLCGWSPGKQDLWICTCGLEWNTFDTGGVCPACLHQWTSTQCLSCSR